MTRHAIVARPLTPLERAKISKWQRLVKERVRAGRRDNHGAYLVRGDDDLAEAIADYSSVAICGWTWPGQERLAQFENQCDRNVRKRIARLQAAGFLIVIPPSDGWASNRYVPMLDDRPLFEIALTSDRVQKAVAALKNVGSDTRCILLLASKAPGKDWLGHWLDGGRETGKFAIVEQDAVVPRVWAQKDTPQWAAWVDYYRANGRPPPTTQHRVNGELQTGWMFASEWPPGDDGAKSSGGAL